MSRRARPQPSRPSVRVATVPPLYHFGGRLFAIFAVAMFIAFWPSYFSQLANQPSSHHHAHGLAMSLWLVLLIAQASLMRSGRRALHTQLGLLSYLLVPVIVVVTLRFVHYTLQEVPQVGSYWLFFLALVVVTLVMFVALFALAMVNRAQPAVHGIATNSWFHDGKKLYAVDDPAVPTLTGSGKAEYGRSPGARGLVSSCRGAGGVAFVIADLPAKWSRPTRA